MVEIQMNLIELGENLRSTVILGSEATPESNSNRFPRPKSRGSLIFAQNSLHPRLESRGFFAQNKDSGQALRLHSGQLKGSELYRAARMTS